MNGSCLCSYRSSPLLSQDSVEGTLLERTRFFPPAGTQREEYRPKGKSGQNKTTKESFCAGRRGNKRKVIRRLEKAARSHRKQTQQKHNWLSRSMRLLRSSRRLGFLFTHEGIQCRFFVYFQQKGVRGATGNTVSLRGSMWLLGNYLTDHPRAHCRFIAQIR